MIRVLHVIGSASAGGVETCVLDLATHVDPDRFLLTVCVPQAPGFVARRLTNSGAKVLEVAVNGNGRMNALSLCTVLAANSWDVAHVNVGGALVRTLLKATGCPATLMHVHALPDGWEGDAHDENLGRRLTAQRTFSFGANAVLVSSRYMQSTMERLLGSSSRKLRYLPLGVDVSRFRRREPNDSELGRLRRAAGLEVSDRVIGFVGRLVAQKGVDTFIHAIRIVLRQVADARCVVIGDGPLRGAFIDVIQEFGGDRCILLGERWDVELWMACFDLLLVPSVWEPFGLVAVEGMACGCPVVASDVQGLRETVLPGRTGFLVRPGDYQGFAQFAIKLLNCTALRQGLSEQARHHAETTFSFQSTVRQLEGLYAEFAATSRRLITTG